MASTSPWVVYVVQCSDGSLYTGITNDLAKRVAAHNSGKGAKYVRSRLPVVLRYAKVVGTRGRAAQEEANIKSLSRSEKLALIGY